MRDKAVLKHLHGLGGFDYALNNKIIAWGGVQQLLY